MLHRYTVKNFFSFREETEISFLLNKHAPDDRRSFISPTVQRLSKAIAIIGPNGSGKTNLIKTLVFLRWFIGESFRAEPDKNILIEPHFFSTENVSQFAVDFSWNANTWRYQLALTPKQVLQEALLQKTSRLFSKIFVREWREGRYFVSQQGFGLNKREAEKVPPNVSLISWAAQHGVPLAKALKNLKLCTNVSFSGRRYLSIHQLLQASDYFLDKPKSNHNMSKLLSAWDLGLAGVEIRKQKILTETGEQKEVNIPFGIHGSGDKQADLPFFQESSGTQGAFVLLSRILPVLRSGGIAVIDEMEADLHPHMLAPILDLFFSEETNPYNAQIIFTCHSMEVLNLLHKGQVIMVQKDKQCESHAWRLDEMQGVRADDNLYAKYMAGAYGAIPEV